MSVSVTDGNFPIQDDLKGYAPSLKSRSSQDLYQNDVKSVEENALANGGYLNVWKNNIDAAFDILRSSLRKGYTFVAMDTEFPGVGNC